MEQHVQLGSFTSPPVARRGARRSPAAWLSVLPCRPQRPGDDRSNRGVVPAGDRPCRRQANCDPDCQARSRAALDRRTEGPAGGAAMGVATERRVSHIAYEKTPQKCVAEKPTKRAILDANLLWLCRFGRAATMRRAAVYLRVSTIDQTTANQERELREIAARM